MSPKNAASSGLFDVQGSRQLTAIAAAWRLMGRDLKKTIRAATVNTMRPEWKKAVAENVAELAGDKRSSRMLLAGVRLAGGNPPMLYAARSRRALKPRGVLTPSQHYYLAEFGSTPRQITYTATSKKGRQFEVTRRSEAGWPKRRHPGPVHNAFAEMAPRFVKLWVQISVKAIYDAVGGK